MFRDVRFGFDRRAVDSREMKRTLITGQRFGRLLVLQEIEKPAPQFRYFCICLCDCGEVRRVAKAKLAGGFRLSCGCLRNDQHAAFKQLKETREGRIELRQFGVARMTQK